MSARAIEWITHCPVPDVCYTVRMPDQALGSNAPVAPGDEQTRTEDNSDTSRDAQLAPSEPVTENSPSNPEHVHTRTDANGDARVRAHRKPPPENWLVIDQVILRFVAGGLPLKLRTVQKYCLNGKLRCTLALTDKNTFKYFIDPASIEEFLAREGQKVPTKTDEIEPASVPRTPDAPGRAHVRDDYDVYEHPYVRRLEREIDDYKQKYDTLQMAARADLIKLHETYAVAQSETLAKYLLLDKGKATSVTPETPPGQSTA